MVEAAFAIFKANSCLNRVSLCLTICLCALSMGSIVMVDLFVDIWNKGGHSALSDIAVFAVIILIYARRASRLLWARPFERRTRKSIPSSIDHIYPNPCVIHNQLLFSPSSFVLRLRLVIYCRYQIIHRPALCHPVTVHSHSCRSHFG